MLVTRFILTLVNSKWKLLCFISAFLLKGNAVHAQYFQFSQYNFTSQRINPATLATSRYASFDVDYRNQKTGGDFNLSSNFISVAYPILNQSTGRPWSGIGLTMMDDRSGGIYKTQEIAASYAINIRLSRFQTLSLAAKGLYQTKRISLDGFYTGSQFIPERGFDNLEGNGESFQQFTNNYTTISTGLYWQETDRKENIIRHWGISIFDINRPDNSFLGNTSQLASTFVIEGGFRAYHKKELSIFPEVLFTGSASNHTLNLGTRFQRAIKSAPNKTVAHVDVLTKYVVGRSGIIGVQLHRENFSFGVSYDFPLIRINSGNLGALEVGLQLRKLVLTRARSKAQAKRKEDELKRKTTKTTIQQNLIKTTPPDTSRQIVTTIPEVEILKKDTVLLQKDASAGKITHEPLLVEKITLHFQFEFNSVDLDTETEAFLEQLSVTLGEDEKLKVDITGHTDNIGFEKFNERLSLKRAEAVRTFLIRKGINPARLKAAGKGMSNQINDNDTEENRARNRRVEMMVYVDY